MGKKQEYKLKNEEYLRKLSQKEGIKKLPNGILYEVIKEGSGEGKVTERSIVTCHYRGSLISGKGLELRVRVSIRSYSWREVFQRHSV